MKKQLFAGLAIVTAASMLCGFSSTETVDSLGQKMNDACKGMTGMSASTNVNLDASIKISDGTTSTDMSVLISGLMDIACTLDPIATKADGSFTLSAMGTTEEIPIQMYMIPAEDGTTKTYMHTDDGWSVNTDSTDLSELIKTASDSSVSFSDLEEWGYSFELAPETTDVDGTECYLLSSVIDSDSLKTMIEKASAMSGEDLTADEDISNAMTLLSGLQLKIEDYVDTSTYLPVKIHVDINGSDLSALTQLLTASMGEQAAGTSVDLTLNDASFDMTVSYNDVDEILVPADALAAE